MSSTVRSVVSSRRRAASTRTAARTRRAWCPPRRGRRGRRCATLIAARRASAGTDRSASRMVGDERQRLAERLALGPPHGQLGAELRLPAGPMGEQHQLAGHLQRQLAAVVVLDQGQGQVHARRDPGRGPHVAVAHVDAGRRSTSTAGNRRASSVARRPVGGGPPAVEQAGLRQQEGPAAHRGDPAARGRPRSAIQAMRRSSARRRRCRCRRRPPACRWAPRREAGRCRATVPTRCVTGCPGAARRSGVGGVGAVAVGHGEHLERARHVERLDVRGTATTITTGRGATLPS